MCLKNGHSFPVFCSCLKLFVLSFQYFGILTFEVNEVKLFVLLQSLQHWLPLTIFSPSPHFSHTSHSISFSLPSPSAHPMSCSSKAVWACSSPSVCSSRLCRIQTLLPNLMTSHFPRAAVSSFRFWKLRLITHFFWRLRQNPPSALHFSYHNDYSSSSFCRYSCCEIQYKHITGARWEFLLQCLAQLSRSLELIHILSCCNH